MWKNNPYGFLAFYDLTIKIAYNAQLAGVFVVNVDPAYTSNTCSACCEIGSRRKHKVVCKSCGNLKYAAQKRRREYLAQGSSDVALSQCNQGTRSGGAHY
ncbi:MAG: transposase [Chloracidobacterium sp.]|nr:transposase [Chloracidobacterium sp.]